MCFFYYYFSVCPITRYTINYFSFTVSKYLVCCIGRYKNEHIRAFSSVFEINVKALINVTRLVAKGLLARKVPGSIVNLSSQASLVGLLDHSVYCASKGAVDAFTRAVALEYGPYNIRVNAVNPTVIMTDMGRLGWSNPKVAEPMLRKIPLRR